MFLGDLEKLCDVCIRAKQNRNNFNESLNKVDALFFYDSLRSLRPL